ncbi:restriction endonuclease subunit S [Methylosarcina fibrata]|uniref:restriction endonuclease subunit S n=1 Tax=Methylosarcina fibrata TaxID=105972 RepID=UPI0003A94FB1|nr:restriction endonuclease subunit S [Methylosarcina fibrata]
MNDNFQPLGSLLDNIAGGGTPSKNCSFYWNGNIPWASVKDFKDNQFGLFKTQDSITEEGLKSCSSKLIPPGIPLLCTRMAVGRASVTSFPTAINQDIKALFPKEKQLDSAYLVRSLHYQQEKLERVSIGSTVKGITLEQIKELLIFVPAIDEQKAIATILDTIDEAIATAEAQLTKQEKIKQGLLQDLMKRGIDETGQIRPHWEDRPDLYKKTELGYLPIAWEVKTIDSLANYVGSGVTPRGGSEVYKNSGILFIRSQNVTFDGLKLADVAYIDQSTHEAMQSSEIMAHDVLLNITGASIGRCCPVPKSLGIANVNQHVCAIRLPKPNEQDANYLSLVLSSYIGQDQIARLNAGGNREGLNYQQIRSFLIPWPKDLERSQIVENLAFHKEDVISGGKELSKLKRIKTGLMQDLLTGQRRVTSELIRQVEILTGSA